MNPPKHGGQVGGHGHIPLRPSRDRRPSLGEPPLQQGQGQSGVSRGSPEVHRGVTAFDDGGGEEAQFEFAPGLFDRPPEGSGAGRPTG